MKNMFKKFLLGTINQVTMAAALRRSNTYLKNTSAKSREKFRKGLCYKLEELAKNYKNAVDDNAHIKNIKLVQEYSKTHKSILKDGKITFGVAQKALNLYLKLLWSQGVVKEPPHCPLDSVIIKKLPRKYKCNWTEISNAREYKKLIMAIKDEAGKKGTSIAKWELVIFQE